MVKVVVFLLLSSVGLTIIGLILAVFGIAEIWDVYIDRDGRAAGFLEPNGAGKTTTIKLLLGLTRPTAGKAANCTSTRPFSIIIFACLRH